MSTDILPLTREKLYELVWQEPMLKVAARYGVASMYMTRVCIGLRVPRPGAGHWSKVAFGKVPPRPPLPSARVGDLTEWQPGTVFAAARQTNQPRVRSIRANAIEAKAARSGQAAVAVDVAPPALKPAVVLTPNDDRHELLVGVKASFLKTRDTDNGLLRPYKRMLVDIVTSERHLDASIDAADALFRALARKGHRVALSAGNGRRPELDEREIPRKGHHHRALWSPDRTTVVHVGEVRFGLTLFEMTESVEMVYMGKGKYAPVRDLTPDQLKRYREPQHWRTTRDFVSGRLGLLAYSTYWRVPWVQRWQETKVSQFASIVPKIVKELHARAPEQALLQAAADAKAEEENRQWEEQRRREEEEAERARKGKAHQDSRADLIAAIASWEQARSIHAYFDSAELEIEQLPAVEQEQLRGRLAEARVLVGEVDALAQLKQWKTPEER